jgi:hypothetical protein
MSHLRNSRPAGAGLTAAVVLLAVPVAAFGQVPGVDQVVGGVNNAAQGVVQAAPAPPVKLPAPAAPAPAAPAPAASAPPSAPAAAPAPAPAPASARGATAMGSQSSGGSGGGGTTAHSSGKSPGGGSHVHALAASDKKASASQDSGGAATDTQIADDPASAPRDASPENLPFTGLQLALVLMAGLAALAAGTVVRRAARQ